ncbi:MAG: L-carnitine dehydratase/bile acid-inducible protein [Frankiales bacterium]|nr:L-carnitine dehydratase/bile acid-inducible protein [Frankiales bacterium]
MYELLQGVRVVDFSTWLFVPSTGAILADWGADVIKIEDAHLPDPSRGLAVGGVATSGISPMVEVANRGKRSVGLDIRTEEGLQLLYRLVASADVFMTNMRTRATERLGIDVDSLRKANPDLICLRATGYGQHGPMADRSAFDLTATWAQGGAGFLSTRPDRPDPSFPAGSFGDMTGALAGAGAIAAALLRRERTGQPSVIDVALQSIGMWMMGTQITLGAMGMLYEPFRQEAPPNPMVNAYRTKDDRWLYFAVMQADRFWASFCEHLDLPELLTDPRYAEPAVWTTKSVELTAIFREAFLRRTLTEWSERLATFDGVWAPALSPAEIPDEPQVQANGFLVDVTYPHGVTPLVASPAQFDGQPLTGVRRAPTHGEHTDEVLLELGMSMEEILERKIDGSVL